MKRHWTAVAKDISEATSLIVLALIESEDGPLAPKVAESFVSRAKVLRLGANDDGIAEALASVSELSILASVLRGEVATDDIEVAPDGVAVVDALGRTTSNTPPPVVPSAPTPARRIVGRLVRVRGEDGVVRVAGMSSIRSK